MATEITIEQIALSKSPNQRRMVSTVFIEYRGIRPPIEPPYETQAFEDGNVICDIRSKTATDAFLAHNSVICSLGWTLLACAPGPRQIYSVGVDVGLGEVDRRLGIAKPEPVEPVFSVRRPKRVINLE